MKKIITILAIFISISTFAQSNRQYVGIAIGPAFPLNDFAKVELSDSTSGFAKTGLNVKIMYSYRLTHNFGIQAHFVYNSNNIHNEKMKSQAELEMPDYSFSISSASSWGVGGIYVGPFLRIPFTDRFSWDVRGLIGGVGGNSPQFTIRGTHLESGEKTEYYREAARTFGFGITAGTGFKYIINNFILSINADYYYSNLEFKDVTGWGWTDANNPTGTPYKITTKQKVNSVALSFGFAYFL